MKKIRLLIVNYTNDSLNTELASRGYDVTTIMLITPGAHRGYEVTINSRNNNRLASELYRKTFDLIYFAKVYPPVWDDLELLFRHNKIPIIYGFHYPALNTHPYRLKNHIFNSISILKLLHIKMAGSISAVHALNMSDYQLLKSLSLDCYNIPLGVNTNKFRRESKIDKFTVLFSSVDSIYAKGTDILAKIVPELLRKAPELRIVFSGGLLSPHLLSLASLYKKNIAVVRFLKQEQFARLLSSTHTLLFPSRFEAFGQTALEALSSGVPVMCFDVPGVPRDIVKKYNVGKIARPFNADEIVDGILIYYQMWRNEPEKYEHLCNTCRQIALQYDWRIIAQHFDTMFREVLNK